MLTWPRWRQRCASAPRATCTGTRLRSARSGWPEQVDNNILFIKIIITVLMIGVSIIITATVLTGILKGAHVVGVNCHFDMFVALETMKKMKAGLQAAGLNPYLMMQPVMILIMMRMRIRGMIKIFEDCLPVPGRRQTRDYRSP